MWYVYEEATAAMLVLWRWSCKSKNPEIILHFTPQMKCLRGCFQLWLETWLTAGAEWHYVLASRTQMWPESKQTRVTTSRSRQWLCCHRGSTSKEGIPQKVNSSKLSRKREGKTLSRRWGISLNLKSCCHFTRMTHKHILSWQHYWLKDGIGNEWSLCKVILISMVCPKSHCKSGEKWG